MIIIYYKHNGRFVGKYPIWLFNEGIIAGPHRGGKYRINGFQTETYGYEGVRGFKTVGFRSNAPAGPRWANALPAPEKHSA